MNIIKKLTAGILILCMFLRLPQDEAVAAETEEYAISSVMNGGPFPQASAREDCTGVYTIFSPCYTDQVLFTDGAGSRSVSQFESSPNDQHLSFDDSKLLPWDDVSEPPTSGSLIPILHF